MSFTHALIILPLSFRNLSSPSLDADRAFGWDEQYGLTASIACGYFLWDTFESSIHFSDIGFVIHGASLPPPYIRTLLSRVENRPCVLLHLLPVIREFERQIKISNLKVPSRVHSLATTDLGFCSGSCELSIHQPTSQSLISV